MLVISQKGYDSLSNEVTSQNQRMERNKGLKVIRLGLLCYNISFIRNTRFIVASQSVSLGLLSSRIDDQKKTRQTTENLISFLVCPPPPKTRFVVQLAFHCVVCSSSIHFQIMKVLPSC